MIVAFDENDRIDYHAMEQLIEWYIERGVDGIFALCQSTEIQNLSFEERYQLGKFVLEKVNGRVSVIIGGVTAWKTEEQLYEAGKLADLGPDALILLTNRVEEHGEGDLVRNSELFIEAIRDVPLGFYEMPMPYKRVLTDDEIRFLADSGKFLFIKDTCCDMDAIRRRAEIVKGSGLRLFNANCASFVASCKIGYSGYSGVMANFHPDLYSALIKMLVEYKFFCS